MTTCRSSTRQASRPSLRCQLLEPGDDGYDEARRVHNGLIDRRPALIARCRTRGRRRRRGPRFAPRAGSTSRVRGGGHNVAGRAVADGALMIDLAEMKDDPRRPRARGRSRAQGGVLWGELNARPREHGLAVTGGAISTTGIAGLTLGGGLGWLMAEVRPGGRQPAGGRARDRRRRGRSR